ncbi:glycosyltransferase family 4 protein [bacterium]|nr:glycosyltransferase family 4 protein [bacterium]
MTSSKHIPSPRVVHLDDGRSWRGGQHQVFLLATELAARGIEQRLVTPPGSPLGIRAHAAGIKVVAFEFGGEMDIFGARRLALKLKNFFPDIVHAHTSHAHMMALRLGRRLRAKVVSTRRVDFAIGKNYFSRRKYTLAGQHFIAISEAVRRVLLEGGVSPELIDIVHSGVPAIRPEDAVGRDDARASLGIAPDEIAIVNIGALTDHKGQRWLIEAAPGVFERLPNARIHIIGEGELREPLAWQVKELDLEERVILHGWVEDVRHKLAGFDLFVSSSHLEGLGTVILDAMLARLPVVAAAAGGVTDVVIEGQTGRLVPPKNANALAGAIVAAVLDPDSSRDMAERAALRAERDFSARAMAEGTLAVYHELLK